MWNVHIVNSRDVCRAKDAGFTKFKAGCMNTPALAYHYCEVHKPTVFMPISGDLRSEAMPPLNART